MDNQHKKIKGYRDLSQAEIDLMNEIKTEGESLKELIAKVEENQRVTTETHGTGDAEGYRWSAIAKTQLQQGLMALTRAVAKPEGF